MIQQAATDGFWTNMVKILLNIPLPPVWVFAGLGYLAHEMFIADDDAVINKRRLMGGIMLAAFTGLACFLLLEAMGLDQKFAFVIGMVVGASGEHGYLLLLKKTKSMGRLD